MCILLLLFVNTAPHILDTSKVQTFIHVVLTYIHIHTYASHVQPFHLQRTSCTHQHTTRCEDSSLPRCLPNLLPRNNTFELTIRNTFSRAETPVCVCIPKSTPWVEVTAFVMSRVIERERIWDSGHSTPSTKSFQRKQLLKLGMRDTTQLVVGVKGKKNEMHL